MIAPAPGFPLVTAELPPQPPRTTLPSGQEFRSPELARLLDEQERIELDRRAQEALARQGAVAGKD